MVFESRIPVFHAPPVPDGLKSYIVWASHCKLTKDESAAFAFAFNAFASEYIQPNRKLFRVNIFILNEPSFTVHMKSSDSDDLGNALHVILIHIYKWRAAKLQVWQMVVCILEELCHIFYLEEDEIKVEYLVTACAKHLWPDVQICDLYTQPPQNR